MIVFPELKNFTIDINSKVKDAIKLINKNQRGIALVTDKNNVLKGVLVDGDIRRLLLKRVSLNNKIKKYLNKNFFYFNYKSRKNIKKYINNQHVPVLDKKKELIGLYLSIQAQNILRTGTVVILAGGKGLRMKNLTKDTPKPLLKIAGTPIIHTQITKMINQGFKDFIILTNYLSNKISDYFKNLNLDAEVQCIKENKYLGTAGPLSLLKKLNISQSFILINGDIITNLNFKEVLNFHNINRNDLTICLRKYNHQIPFGVLSKKSGFRFINEKPIASFLINSGIYIISKKILKRIKNSQHLEMNHLINKLFKEKLNIKNFIINDEVWDVGDKSQYENINKLFQK
jgi:dTDP-glucose pyrophosphorylase